MKLLALECSASPVSCCVFEDGRIIASSFVNVKLTHSRTLMPMIKGMLEASLTDISEIDGFAVASGPGSFTGIRIGISAVKGFAAAGDKPCVGVSTLYAMANCFCDSDCLLCAVMDARCRQVYAAVFDISGGKISRITEDSAVMCEELSEKIKKMSKSLNKRVIIVGDGANVFYPFVDGDDKISLPPADRIFQNAVGVALAAWEAFKRGEAVSPDMLLPVYLRLPQAERELKARQKQEEKL